MELVAGYLVAGLFFLRFWRASPDRLFASFAAAFWLLAALAFMLIIAAFADKNRKAAEAGRFPHVPLDVYRRRPYLAIDVYRNPPLREPR